MEAIKTGVSVVWKVVQFGMFCWALSQVFSVRNLWLETVPESADVLTVQAKGFWGPVHVLVPKNCKIFENNDAEDRNKENEGHERDDTDKENEGHERDNTDKENDGHEHDDTDNENDGHERDDADNENDGHERDDTDKKNDGHERDDADKDNDGHERDDAEEESHESRRLAPPGLLRGLVAAEEVEVRLPFEKVAERTAPLQMAGEAAPWWHFAPGGQAGSPVDATVEEAFGRRLHESDDADDVTYNDTHITVKRCGKTLHFEQPTARQRYLAMLFMSGNDTMEELRQTRVRMLWLFAVAGLIENFANCFAGVGKAVLPAGDYQFLGSQDTLKNLPAPVKAVRGLVTDTLQKFATLQNQLAIMSLFFVYWHNHAYIVSFIPGKAYIFLFCTYLVLLTLPCAQACGGPAVLVAGVVLGCWLLFVIPCVVFPMIFGYSFYSANFLWNTALADAVSADLAYGMIDIKTEGDYLEKDRVMEAEWAGSTQCVRSAADGLFGAHAVEIASNFVLNCIPS